MPCVFVTGATGFIGRHLVKYLIAQGEQVRCLIHRNEAPLAGVECVRGDITAPETLGSVVQGVDVVYHLAGATRVVSPRCYRPINGLGTRNLGEACACLSNPPTLVYLSSLAAAGPSSPDRPRREEDPPVPVSEYGRSKLMGERFLRRLADRLPVTVVRPPGVFGPGDRNLLPLFKTARLGLNFVPSRIDQRMSLIYVDDLVRSLPRAAAHGERLRGATAGLDHPQGVYFVGMDECPSMVELGNLAGRAVNQGAVRSVPIPCWLGRIVGHANDFVSRLTMQPLLLSSDKMREAVAGSWTCSSEKAKGAWGFACPIELADRLQETVRWYRRHRWL
jgi:nucleoside-diphosphate-sugar epimerase